MIVLPSNGQEGYNLTRSLRFRAGASATLTRTFGTPTSQSVFTLSMWVKRGALSVNSSLFGDSAGNNVLRFISSDVIRVEGSVSLASTAVFRDPSAMYHIVYRQNGTTATVWVNNNSVLTGTVTVSSLNTAAGMTLGGPTSLGSFDGYMAETNFIDGQALTPSSFGSINSTTGVWQPAAYTGTYGTNGFYLPYTDNSALTTSSNVGLGKDFSGNGNYWTTNNISITAGVTYDSMTDVPTLTSATAANFAVLNPLTTPAGGGAAFSASGGNLNCAVAYCGLDSTIAMSSGKWYWEVIPTSGTASNNPRIGIVPSNHGVYTGTSVGDPVGTYGYASTGQKGSGGTYTAYGASYTDNDVIGVALDIDAGTLAFYKNGVSQGTAYTGLTGSFFASVGTGSSATMNLTFNFGQRPFTYTPPSGFVALNNFNIPAGSITTSGSFTGNVSADGPSIYLNGVPTAMTINGNAVTLGTHADKTAYGFKVRSSSTSYNSTGTNTYSITTTGAKFKFANAQGNP